MLLRCAVFRIPALNLLLLAGFCSVFVHALSGTRSRQDLIRTINLPIEQWLDQPERTEIPWKVSISRPLLTYQLRNLVRVTAEVPADLLQQQAMSHDLHFIVKVGSERGVWDGGESYSHFRVEAKLDPRSELQMLADLYLQSGVYTIATIAYDATSEKRSISFNRIQIGEPDHDPFPQLLGSAPKIEFLPPPDNAAPLGTGHVLLPIATQRPLQLDLIVDLSTLQDEDGIVESRRLAYPSYPPYPWNPEWEQLPDRRRRMASDMTPNRQIYEQSQLLQVASLLSAIEFKQGCIQVEALDILHRRTILPFTSASEVEWGKIRDQILSPDYAVVSIADLKGKRDAAKFFQHELERTIAQPPRCKLDFQNPFQIIAILSRGVTFPSGSDKPRLQPGCQCKIFYLQQTDQQGYGGADLKNMLKPLSPIIFQFGDPHDFRQKLLEFTQTMEKLP